MNCHVLKKFYQHFIRMIELVIGEFDFFPTFFLPTKKITNYLTCFTGIYGKLLFFNTDAQVRLKIEL